MNYFFLSLLLAIGMISPLSLSETHCPCDEIKQTQKCTGDPNCIKICILENSLTGLNEMAINQCLEDYSEEKTYSLKDTPASEFEDFLKEVKKKMAEREELQKKELNDNCPDCGLVSSIQAVFDPTKQPDKNCAEEYLRPHRYNKGTRIELQEGEACADTQKEKIYKYFQDYISNIISGEDESELSKKLWKDCPDPCSFAPVYTIKINPANCSGVLNLVVHCTHRVEREWFVPVYDMSITHKGEIQCQEI